MKHPLVIPGPNHLITRNGHLCCISKPFRANQKNQEVPTPWRGSARHVHLRTIGRESRRVWGSFVNHTVIFNGTVTILFSVSRLPDANSRKTPVQHRLQWAAWDDSHVGTLRDAPEYAALLLPRLDGADVQPVLECCCLASDYVTFSPELIRLLELNGKRSRT